jgi:hypothetical protein
VATIELPILRTVEHVTMTRRTLISSRYLGDVIARLQRCADEIAEDKRWAAAHPNEAEEERRATQRELSGKGKDDADDDDLPKPQWRAALWWRIAVAPAGGFARAISPTNARQRDYNKTWIELRFRETWTL